MRKKVYTHINRLVGFYLAGVTAYITCIMIISVSDNKVWVRFPLMGCFFVLAVVNIENTVDLLKRKAKMKRWELVHNLIHPEA